MVARVLPRAFLLVMVSQSLLGHKITANGEEKRKTMRERHSRVRAKRGIFMSLLAVTVGADPSTVVDAVRAVGWYGVRVGQRLACSGSCAGALAGEPVYWVDGDCGDCGFRPFVEVSLYAQPGVVEQDVFVEVEPGTRWCLRITRLRARCCLLRPRVNGGGVRLCRLARGVIWW